MWGGGASRRWGVSVAYWAPHLEYAVVVEQAAPAHGEVIDGRLAHGRVVGVGRVSELDVRVALENHVAGRVQFVGEVIDRVPVRQPDGQAVVSGHWRVSSNQRHRPPELGDL